MEEIEKEDIKYLSFGEFLSEDIIATYTTTKKFNSRRIEENKIRNESARKMMDELGVKLMYTPNTKHTNIALNIDNYPEEKEGLYKDISENKKQYILKFIPKECDAIIGSLRGKPISFQMADCNAIYLYDTKNGVYGLAHSGWKGTLNLIIINTIEKMKEDFNTDPKDLKVVLAPAISKESFSVHSDVYTLFEDMLEKLRLKKEDYIFNDKNEEKNTKKCIDLKKIIIDILIKKYNVKEENILNIKEDTVTKKEGNKYKYHSHRRDKEKAGRNMAVIYKKRKN